MCARTHTHVHTVEGAFSKVVDAIAKKHDIQHLCLPSRKHNLPPPISKLTYNSEDLVLDIRLNVYPTPALGVVGATETRDIHHAALVDVHHACWCGLEEEEREKQPSVPRHQGREVRFSLPFPSALKVASSTQW